MRIVELMFVRVMDGMGSGPVRANGCGVPRIERTQRRAAKYLLAVLAGLAAFSSSAAPPADNGRGGKSSGAWADGRVLVMPRPGLTEKERRRRSSGRY